MAGIKGKVGDFELSWETVPRGPSGMGHVRLGDGRTFEVRWRRDSDGLSIELPHGFYGFSFSAERDDEGRKTFSVSERLGPGYWSGLEFSRVGESVGAAGGGRKKGLKLRAQMPGKIVRLLVKPGQDVQKDQPLVVMEAMKMENELRASQSGRVSKVQVSEGQAVDTGADLVVFE